MASKSKTYETNFVIRQNTKEAIDEVEKFGVAISGFSKIFQQKFDNVFEKSFVTQRKFNKITSKSNEMMKMLSEYSKLELMPKKEIDKISDLRTELSSVVKKVNELVSSGKELTKLQYDEITDSLESVGKRMADITKSSDEWIKSELLSNEAMKEFDRVLSKAKDDYEDLSDNKAFKETFEDNLKIAEKLKKKLEKAVNSKKPEEEIRGLVKQLKDVEDKLNTITSANKKLESASSATGKAMDLVNRLVGDIQEGIEGATNVVPNTALQNEYKAVLDTIQQTRDEIIKLNNNDIKGVRKKIGELEVEEDKIKSINKKLQGVIKLEQESIPAIVKRAKEQDKINDAYREQIKSQKKGLVGIIEQAKVYKQGLPTKAIATFGEAGVVAGKGIAAAFKGLSAVFAPLLGLTSLIAVVKMLFDLERQVKASRKQVFMMAADSNTMGEAMRDVGKGVQLAATDIEKMTRKLDSFDLIDLGINFEQATEAAKGFVKEGFKATDVVADLSDESGGMFAMAADLGMELGELTSRAGELRKDWGMSLGQTADAFDILRKEAKNAGINVSIFFDKVLAASTGLALWGQKVTTVSAVYSTLFKAMKLPEAVGTELASNMVKGFSEMSTEMQIVSYEQGRGAKMWKKYSAQQNASIDMQIEAAKKEGDYAKVSSLLREKDAIKNLDSLRGLSGEMARARKMDVGKQIMMQLQAAGSKFGVDFEANIEDVDTGMKKSMYEMEKLGEVFGIDRKTMQGFQEITKHIKENVIAFQKAGEAAGVKKEVSGLIDILGGSQRINVKIRDILKKSGKKQITQGEMNDLIEQFPTLENEIRAAAKDNEFDYNKFGGIVDAQLADPAKKSLAIQKQIEKMGPQQLDVFASNLKAQGIISQEVLDDAKKNGPSVLIPYLSKIQTTADLANLTAENAGIAEAKARGVAMLQQTKSTEDAINNSITKILRDSFRFLEKLFNLFSIVFPGQAKQLEKLSEGLEDNKQVGEENVSILDKQEKALDLGISGLQGQQGAEGTIKQLESKKEIIKKAKEDEKTAIEASEKLRKATLKSRGKVTPEIEKLTEEHDTALAAAKESKKQAKQAIDEIKKTDIGKEILGKAADIVPTEMKTTAELSPKLGKELGERKQERAMHGWGRNKMQGGEMIPTSAEQILPTRDRKNKEQKVSKQTQTVTGPITTTAKGPVTFTAPVLNSKGQWTGNLMGDSWLTFGKVSADVEKAISSDPELAKLYANASDEQVKALSQISYDSKDAIGEARKILKPTPKAGGGFVPGTGSTDSVLGLLTPGEYVIPKDIMQNIDKYALGGTVPGGGGIGGGSKVIYDNRIINLYVNQADKNTMYQIALNAMYSDKV